MPRSGTAQDRKKKLYCLYIQEHDGYISKMLKHSERLKNEEHIRRIEMAEEEHDTKMQILRQKLKLAVMETEILKVKKLRGRSDCDSGSANEGFVIL